MKFQISHLLAQIWTPRVRSAARQLLAFIAIAILAEMIAPRFLVAGQSMQPTFQDHQRLIASPLPYALGDPERGDIIVLKSPESPIHLVKRIVGLPGDVVEMRAQQLYINGDKVDEPYVSEKCSATSCPDQFWFIGADDYFVLGDNRNHSKDSRSFGPIARASIIGEALISYWPPQNWGLIK